MPKLNIYVDEDLFKRIRKSNVPISQVCQEALRTATNGAEAADCQECEAPATFHVQTNGGQAYTCKRHLTVHLDGISTVRAL